MALVDHRFGQIIHASESGESCRFCVRSVASRMQFFCPQICQVVVELSQIPAAHASVQRLPAVNVH